MAFGSITAANSTLTLSIDQVYPGGIAIFGWGVDDAFTAEAVEIGETQVGVDGYGVAGLVYMPAPFRIRLLASSPSIVVFENWIMSEFQVGDKLATSMILSQPGPGRVYTGQLGYLRRISELADARRVLQNREFNIEFLPQGPGQPAISMQPYG